MPTTKICDEKEHFMNSILKEKKGTCGGSDLREHFVYTHFVYEY